MPDRYLLYIDILGFSDLVEKEPGRVEELYTVIASLNAHKHHAFRVIVFSDTILVYNPLPALTVDDRCYLIMFLCEFAQDLLHWLVGRDIAFRAIIVDGSFFHFHMNDVPCFFGSALTDAYKREKNIKCTGLFIDSKCNKFNRIFPTERYDDRTHFVYVTQQLTEWEDSYSGMLPLDSTLTTQTDTCWLLGPEVLMLRRVREQARSHSQPDVREKYASTWAFYLQRYPLIIESLESVDFRLESISEHFDWRQVLDRVPVAVGTRVHKVPVLPKD